MTTKEISAQYTTGLSRQGIERALLDAGKDMEHLTPADLGMLEDYHTLGRIATTQLAELARITGQDRVLDAGAWHRRDRAVPRRRLRVPGSRHRPDPGVLRDGQLAQQAHRPRREDHRPAGRRHSPAVPRRQLRRGDQPARPDERGGQGPPVRRGAPGPGHRRPPRHLGHHGGRARRAAATRCRGRISPTAATSCRPPSYVPPSRAPGSPSITGRTSPAMWAP